MHASEHVWFNGRLVDRAEAAPSVGSNTLNLGTSVFDGLMAYRNGDRWLVHLADAHLERFVRGSRAMGLDHGYTASQLSDGIDELLGTLPPVTHYIRPIAYRTGPEPFFGVVEDTSSVCLFAVPVTRDLDAPYRCQLSPVQRVHHRAIPVSWKVSGCYANSYLAEAAAWRAGYDTGIMLDRRGNVCESSSSNVLFVDGNTLVTPPCDGDVFPGLTRGLLLDLAATVGAGVSERDIAVEELADFDAAMLCGTLSEVRPVGSIGSVGYASVENELFRALLGRFRDCTHGVASRPHRDPAPAR